MCAPLEDFIRNVNGAQEPSKKSKNSSRKIDFHFQNLKFSTSFVRRKPRIHPEKDLYNSQVSAGRHIKSALSRPALKRSVQKHENAKLAARGAKAFFALPESNTPSQNYGRFASIWFHLDTCLSSLSRKLPDPDPEHVRAFAERHWNHSKKH